MKVRYLGNTEGISLTKNKIYEALDYEEGFLIVSMILEKIIYMILKSFKL